MSKIDNELQQRSNNQCELCKSTEGLQAFAISPKDNNLADNCAYICSQCHEQITNDNLEENHWRCLNDSMWSTTPAVQVLAYRLLNRLSEYPWAQDLLDMLYLDEDMLEWAQAGIEEANENEQPTLDSNGAVLQAGDNVTIIKDLNVKGAGFTAKRGTAVRNISLTNNPEHIEGRVNGVRVVLLSCYLKKS